MKILGNLPCAVLIMISKRNMIKTQFNALKNILLSILVSKIAWNANDRFDLKILRFFLTNIFYDYYKVYSTQNNE